MALEIIDIFLISDYLHWKIPQNRPALRAIVKLSELSVRYLPCPVHITAAPKPSIPEAAYKTQGLTIKNEAI